jgi:hypothetical protein
MKDVATFLTEVAESRLCAQIAARAGFVVPPDLCLPRALELPIKHRWLISPVLARSEYAVHSARIGVPTSEREQIEYWFVRYGAEANWLLETGAGVIALEIELSLARHSLAYLAGDDWSWQRSLHFAVLGKRHVLFEYGGGLTLPVRYPGLRLHSSNSPILIPPSKTPSSIELRWANLHAPLLPPPNWLREIAGLD